MLVFVEGVRTISVPAWCVLAAVVVLTAALDGPNVCTVQQKYNITKRIKYRAPMSVRSYEWCFAMPPRCSKWTTEIRDLTRFETEERAAEVAVCCPGYKMTDVACVAICPNGKTGVECSEDCPQNKWGPNCANECKSCNNQGTCSPITGECLCQHGWKGESCQVSITTTVPTSTVEDILTYKPSITKLLLPSTTTTYFTKVSQIPVKDETNDVDHASKTIKLATSTAKTTSNYIVGIDTLSTKNFTKKTEQNEKAINLQKNETVTTPKVKEILIGSQEKSKILTTGNFSEMIINTTKATITPTVPTLATMRSTVPTLLTSTPTYKTSAATIKMKSNSSIIISSKQSTQTTVQTTKFYVRTTVKPETTIKIYPTTMKFKPKEIWIRPAQKGDVLSESKTKTVDSKHRNDTKKDLTFANTTPRTIIVSIIPTSISYSTFKKIALTTALYPTNKTIVVANSTSRKDLTKPMSIHTTTFQPTTLKTTTKTTYSSTASIKNVTKQTSLTSRDTFITTLRNNIITNSMTSLNFNMKSKPIYLTTVPSSTKAIQTTKNLNISTALTIQTLLTHLTTKPPEISSSHVTKTITNSTKENIEAHTVHTKNISVKKITEKFHTSRGNLTNNFKPNTLTTEDPETEETFHILTEPEHITAVMDKERERASVDLISVISIAGGVMMAIITVAVVIVMIERCRRPRYEHVRKVNDIRMQVMIDNNDIPPPYVRSIFHTPLPEPPSDKCHYQPISTLDRNLKQFMRPVVVQTISPIMLENFRDILECHYDHLPRRPQYEVPVAPSSNNCEKLHANRASYVTDSTIEALKCEAKLDEIDSSNSEPLYAEIPCWRPPSEHAVEIMTVNGEAVTEL